MLSLVVAFVLSPLLAADEGASREAVRARGSVALAGSAGYVLMNDMPHFGPGLTLDVGLTVADRYSFTLHGTFTTIVVLTTLHPGLAFDVQLNEHVSVGTGAGLLLSAFLEGPGAVTLTLPLRFSWLFAERPEGAIGRRGFFAFLEGHLDYVVAATRSRRDPRPLNQPVAVGAVLGVGYAWW